MDGVRTVFYERDDRTAARLTARWVAVSTVDGGSRLEMTWARPTQRASDAATMVAADEAQRLNIRAAASSTSAYC